MLKQLCIKTKFGWISAFEEKDKIIKVKFGKHKNKSISKNLKNFKVGLNDFLKGKSKSINSNFSVSGNPIQKKVWKELKNIKFLKSCFSQTIVGKLQ